MKTNTHKRTRLFSLLLSLVMVLSLLPAVALAQDSSQETPYSATIRFNANGGYYSLTNMKVFSETPEITVTIPDDLPTRRGHEF